MGSYTPKRVEIRPSSIKGAIRFWWRALHANWTIDQLREKEAEIFGAASGKSAGRSKVLIKCTNIRVQERDFSEYKYGLDAQLERQAFTGQVNTVQINILDYLAYGRHDTVSFSPGGTFNLDIHFLPGLSEEDRESVLLAIAALSEYGNVGGKSRNGFGKIAFSCLKGRREVIDKQLFHGEKTDYTAGSQEAALFETNCQFRSWQLALGEIGDIYRIARIAIERKGIHDTRRRAYIALPINDNDSKYKASIASKNLSRHSKPLFLSIVQNEEEQYKGRILLLPYQYLAGNTHGSTQEANEFDATMQLLQKEFAGQLSRER